MRKLLLMMSVIILVACGSDSVTSEPTEESQEASQEDDLTQDELNETMREEAIEADFVSIITDEVEEGTKLKATGEIKVLDGGVRGGDFMLSVKEGEDEYGVYEIVNLNTEEIPLEEGQTVTIYGSYFGKDELGMPVIIATIIEHDTH